MITKNFAGQLLLAGIFVSWSWSKLEKQNAPVPICNRVIYFYLHGSNMTLPYPAVNRFCNQTRNIIREKIRLLAGINLNEKLANRVAVLLSNGTDHNKRSYGDVWTYLVIRPLGYEEG